MKRGILLGIVVLCVAAIAYFVMIDRSDRSNNLDDGLLYPDLVDQINDINSINIITKKASIKVIYDDKIWRVQERSSYPAALPVVRNFLIGISQLRKIEAKTKDPQRYAELDVAGVGMPGSNTVHVMLSVSDDQPLVDLLVGKYRPSGNKPEIHEYFVRIANQDRTWLTESALALRSRSLDWLDRSIVDIELDRIREVRLIGQGQRPIRVFRESMEDTNFLLDEISDGHKIRHQFAVNDIAKVLAGLKLEDVTKAQEGPDTVKMTFETFGGLVVAVTMGDGEFSDYAVLRAAFRESASDDIRAEAKNLNEKWRGWAYKLSATRIKSINASFDDLIETVENE